MLGFELRGPLAWALLPIVIILEVWRFLWNNPRLAFIGMLVAGSMHGFVALAQIPWDARPPACTPAPPRPCRGPDPAAQPGFPFVSEPEALLPTAEPPLAQAPLAPEKTRRSPTTTRIQRTSAAVGGR